jgi:F-type H+-transporting ATPase subunit gamma
MATLRDIKQRISSVKNTQQITKAMKMVSAAKLRRAQEKAFAFRDYASELAGVTSRLTAVGAAEGHPLAAERPVKKLELFVVTSDKGLCGGFNGNVLNQAVRFLQEREEGVEINLVVSGKKARDYLKRRPWPIIEEYLDTFRGIDRSLADGITANISDRFVNGESDAVYIIFNEFISVIQQKVVLQQILPLQPPAEDEALSLPPEYIFEPDLKTLGRQLFPELVFSQIYRALLESSASEHGARMAAMDAATRNAGDLISRLTLTYNRARQAAITKELIEVVSGADALAG